MLTSHSFSKNLSINFLLLFKAEVLSVSVVLSYEADNVIFAAPRFSTVFLLKK
uniref:Uncharacterized protein n=1 Tax=Glossina morsitans morsitans TaxID=37546 RepID=A0A1B0FNC5_GLOMM